jgi:lipopolysaccharide transport system ATP-binding protein
MSNDSLLLKAQDITLTYSMRRGLFKRFNHEALKGISLDLYRGETVGILGRNGEGKSTLLRILAGIIQPTSGTITCASDVSRILLSIGLGFMPNITGRENALYSTMLQGVSYKKAKSMLSAINDFAELGEFFEQPISTYSAGMKARLGFATAIMTDVDIMFVDEVLSVGDENFKKKAEEAMLSKLNGKQTAVFVSHSAPQIRKICNRAVWIDDGKVRAAGDAIWVTNKYHLHMLELQKIEQEKLAALEAAGQTSSTNNNLNTN